MSTTIDVKGASSVIDFPESSLQIRELAQELVKYLRNGIKNTYPPRRKWSDQNFGLLKEFAELKGADSYSHYFNYEFLWDFTAFIPGHGVLLAAESEFNAHPDEIKRDFEKLLYVRSPLKLMMCRIDTKEDTEEKAARRAEEICHSLEERVRDDCTFYSPGEVFILYCVWWALEDGKNRDIAYLLQMDGEPKYQKLSDKHFERVSAGTPS